MIFEVAGNPTSVRQALFQYLLLPLLRLAPQEFQEASLQSKARVMMGILEGRPGDFAPAARWDSEIFIMDLLGFVAD